MTFPRPARNASRGSSINFEPVGHVRPSTHTRAGTRNVCLWLRLRCARIHGANIPGPHDVRSAHHPVHAPAAHSNLSEQGEVPNQGERKQAGGYARQRFYRCEEPRQELEHLWQGLVVICPWKARQGRQGMGT